MSEVPDEDTFLVEKSTCVHDWVDLYQGAGTDRHNPYIALATFFCKKCLDIRIKSYSQTRFHLNKDFLEDFDAD